MNESTIQNALARHVTFKGHHSCLPNVYHYWFESDLISVTRAGFVHVYEIKLSLSDYRADFEKDRIQYGRLWSNGAPPAKLTRHDQLKEGNGPNYFTFVVPRGILGSERVPDHCGLFEVIPSDNGRLKIDEARAAPRLHAAPIEPAALSGLRFKAVPRFWEQRTYVELLRAQLAEKP